jgi:hypothetical protein
MKGLEKLYAFRKSRRSLGKPYLQSFAQMRTQGDLLFAGEDFTSP